MLTPEYVTGFSEGEAVFTYSRGSEFNINLYFAIKLNSDDKELLREINNFFGVGKIYNVKESLPGKYSGHTRPGSYYRVTRISDLPRIIEHFDSHPLQGKKQKVYKIWREIFFLKTKYRKSDYEMIWQLVAGLSKLTSKNSTIKE